LEKRQWAHRGVGHFRADGALGLLLERAKQRGLDQLARLRAARRLVEDIVRGAPQQHRPERPQRRVGAGAYRLREAREQHAGVLLLDAVVGLLGLLARRVVRRHQRAQQRVEVVHRGAVRS